MDKHVFVWRPPDSDIAVFARAGQGAVERRLDGIPFARATVHHTHALPPRLGLVPYQRTPIALVSLSGTADALASARAISSAARRESFLLFACHQSRAFVSSSTFICGARSPTSTSLGHPLDVD